MYFVFKLSDQTKFGARFVDKKGFGRVILKTDETLAEIYINKK